MRLPIHLNNEIERLKELINDSENYDLQSQTSDLIYSYKTMLQMFANNVDDPLQYKIYEKLCLQCSRLITKVERLSRLKREPYKPYARTALNSSATCSTDVVLEQLEHIGTEICQLEQKSESTRTSTRLDSLIDRREELLNMLFARTWTADQWESAEVHNYLHFLTSPDVLQADKQLILSAITLSLAEYADIRKLELLAQIYEEDENNETDARIMLALVLLLNIESRIDSYRLDRVRSVFLRLMTLPKAQEDLYNIITACEFTYNTREQTEKFENTIIPALGQKIKESNSSDALEEIMSHIETDGLGSINPQINKLMKEVRMIKADGADTSYNLFIGMKDYGYLDEMAHWFSPFEWQQKTIRDAMHGDVDPQKVRSLFKSIHRMSMCSIDKYKLFLTMLRQPKILANIQGIITQEDEFSSDAEFNPTTSVDRKSIMQQTVYNMWRFLSFHPQHAEIPWCREPNTAPIPHIDMLDIAQYAATHHMFESQAQRLLDFLLRYKKYDQAVRFADDCLKTDIHSTNATFNLLAARAYLAIGQTDKAEACLYVTYGSGEKPIETLQLMAQTASDKGNYSDAASYYALLLQDDPKNLKWLRKKADCHSRAGETKQAIQTLYELSYLDDGSGITRIALAKELLRNHQTEKALEQLNGFLPDKADNSEEEEALLLKGFILAELNQRQEAIQTLTKAYSINQKILKEDKTHTTFLALADNLLKNIFDEELLCRTEYILDIAMAQACIS